MFDFSYSADDSSLSLMVQPARSAPAEAQTARMPRSAVRLSRPSIPGSTREDVLLRLLLDGQVTVLNRVSMGLHVTRSRRVIPGLHFAFEGTRTDRAYQRAFTPGGCERMRTRPNRLEGKIPIGKRVCESPPVTDGCQAAACGSTNCG